MIIGVPRERKNLEKRVGLTPYGAKELVEAGHEVRIETGAGVGSFFDDAAYQDVGCIVVPTLKDVWASELVVKVKEPHEEEYQYFRKGLLLFDYLHLASLENLTKKLCETQVTSLAYELVRSPKGGLPLLEPMSEVAGKLSIICGSYYLLSQNGGRGVLLGGTVGVKPAKVVVIGLGIAGLAALKTAVGMGAEVTAVDTKMEKLSFVQEQYQGRVKTNMSNATNLSIELSRADLVIGAVLVPGAKAPKIITRQMVKEMKTGSVFVDISIDQGGCSETSKVTSLAEPVYVEEGVLHYCVPNMPAQSPRTSTLALTAATLPYVKLLADKGFEVAIQESEALKASVNTHAGILTNKAVAEAFGLTAQELPWTPIDLDL